MTNARTGGRSRARAVLGAVVLGAVAVLACAAPADDSRGETTLTDSAGIVTVHHSSTVMEAAPALELVEELRIGTVDGPEETQLFDVGGAARGPGGEIVVLDRGSHEVRVFAADGSFLRRFGREGDGPGELRSPRAVSVHGDTVIVHDGRPHLYRLDGTFLRDGVPAPRGEGRPNQGMVRRVGSSWIVRVEDCVGCPTFEDGAEVRQPVTLSVYDPFDGTVGGTLLAYERPEATVLVEGGVGSLVRRFFQADPATVLGRGGFAHHPGSEYRVEIYREDGALRRRITADVPPRPVTAALMDDVLARIAEGGGGRTPRERDRETQRRRAEILGHAGTLPVLGGMKMSSAGWVMVERLDLGNPLRHEIWLDEPEPTRWDVFDAGGRLVGHLSIPPLIAPLVLTEGGLIALTRDELHVEYVLLHRFEAAPPG